MTNEILRVLALGMPGQTEWIIILVIAVLIFGKRLPDIARSIGKSITEFKKGVNEAKNDITSSVDKADEAAKQPTTQSPEDTLRAGGDEGTAQS